MCQLVPSRAPLRPELFSAGWTPDKAATWSTSSKRRQGGLTGGILEDLTELRKADLDQASDALADPSLVLDQPDAEASRLADFNADQWLPGWRLVAHSQLRQCARIGGVRLGPPKTALGEVLGLQRVHHRDLVPGVAKVTGQRQPVVATGLYYHPFHRALALQPVVQLLEAAPVVAVAQQAALGSLPVRPADRSHMLGRPHVDANHYAHGPLLLVARPQGVPASPWLAFPDLRSPVTRRRIPIAARRHGAGAGDYPHRSFAAWEGAGLPVGVTT